jgi:hypothetical protein
MPGADDRIRDALRGTAREPSLDGVFDRVRAKRRRRQVVRRIEGGVLAAALIAAVAVVSTNVLDDEHRQIAVSPTPSDAPVVRVADGLTLTGFDKRAEVERVRIEPDVGYVTGPLLVADDLITFAAYDRVGDSYDFPPSRIVRVQPDGAVVDQVELEGEVLALAVGEGARWALTRDKVVMGPKDPEFRVKRIGPDNTEVTNAVPPGEQPLGEIVADGGGVWVPVRDGVLRFDAVTGAYAAKVPLTTVTDRRGIAAGAKAVTVTDGLTQVRLDPARDVPVDPFAPSAVDGVDELVDAASDQALGILLGRSADGTAWTLVNDEQQVRLPAGLVPSALTGSGEVVWLEGDIDGTYVLELESGDQLGVARTLLISRTGGDTQVTFVSDDTMFLTSEGRMYRVRLPR